jgi:hypothetical protein
MIFLIVEFWPFLLAAFAVGIATGWLAARPRANGGGDSP